MIKVNKEALIQIRNSLKGIAVPAYSGWTRGVLGIDLYKNKTITLYSEKEKFNLYFAKEEFYFLNMDTNKRPGISHGIVIHLPADEEKDSPYDLSEIAFIYRPVMEPANVGDIVFSHQSIRLDAENQMSLMEFLESDIPDNVKEIFLFKLNEFEKDGE